MKTKFPFLGIGLAIIFILIGLNLTTRNNNVYQIIGYSTVVFFSFLIIVSLLKIFKK